MYVKTSTVRRGDRTYRYLSLVEAYREDGKVRHELVCRLGEAGELRSSGQLDRIISALRRHAEGTWLEAGELSATADAPSFGNVTAVSAYFSRFSFDEHFAHLGDGRGPRGLADTVFVMVANRLIDPRSKRGTVIDWMDRDVALPAGVSAPSLDRCYRALEVVADDKEATEAHLYQELANLANLDLRLCCYDLTSTYFEGDPRPSARFPSKAFGYSRDHRGDRPQVVVGLLTTTDGLPIAHHVFPGNTADVATLEGVVTDLARRFAVFGLTFVADRGLVSEHNLSTLVEHGLDYVIATRLHHDGICRAALVASTAKEANWVPVPEAKSFACDVEVDGQRCRRRRLTRALSPRPGSHDRAHLARTEKKLLALEHRVRRGRALRPGRDRPSRRADPSRDRESSGCSTSRSATGRFLYHYDEAALDYEEQLLAGRYVLLTSHTPTRLPTEDVAAHLSRIAREPRTVSRC